MRARAAGSGVEERRVAAVADGDGMAGDAEAAGVGGFLGGDGHEHVGDAPGGPLHEEGGGAAGPGRRLVEQEAVAGIGDPRHAGGIGGPAGEEAADRHVAVHDVRALAAQQADEGYKGAELGERRDPAHEGGGFDAEPLGADVGQQRTLGADAHDLVAPGADGAHQRQDEVAQGEIDVGDLDDFHGGRADATGSREALHPHPAPSRARALRHFHIAFP